MAFCPHCHYDLRGTPAWYTSMKTALAVLPGNPNGNCQVTVVSVMPSCVQSQRWMAERHAEFTATAKWALIQDLVGHPPGVHYMLLRFIQASCVVLSLCFIAAALAAEENTGVGVPPPTIHMGFDGAADALGGLGGRYDVLLGAPRAGAALRAGSIPGTAGD